VRHLADWGATVIRVEQPVGPPGSAAYEDVVGRERGPDYQNLHRNKRSIRLDLKQPEGHEVFMALVRGADVLVENMRPRVKHRLGVSFEALSQVNPRLVYGSISGFGQTGPYHDRPGLDHIAQGMSGLMSVTGEPGRKPLRTGIAVGDMTAGNIMALNIMMALYERERTGRGRFVHTSLIEGLLFMMDFQAARWLNGGEVARSVGNEHPTAIPTDVFATTDGYVTLSAPSSRMWPKLCDVLGRPDWAARPDWGTRDGRQTDRAEIHAAIAEVILTRSTQAWIDVFNDVGVTCGPIYTTDQAFGDEQVRHLGVAVPVEHPVLGSFEVVGSPLNFDGTPRQVRRPTPDSGADGPEILRCLGYSSERIAELQGKGVC
jgi:formyl-CoA transferase